MKELQTELFSQRAAAVAEAIECLKAAMLAYFDNDEPLFDQAISNADYALNDARKRDTLPA